MKKYLIYLLVLSLTACSLDFGSDNDSDPEEFKVSNTFNVVLSGSQEVPSVTSDNKAEAIIEYDEDRMQFRAKLDATEVDNFSAAHIHQGYVGTNGDVAFAFEPSETSGMYYIEETMLDQAAVEEMLDGGWYVNVHTQENPSGALRGQILTDDFILFTFKLSGEQEVPAVDTNAMGYGYATYHQTSGELDLKVTAMALEGANAAHIHTGRMGTNGGVAIALSQGADASQWVTPSETMIDSGTAETLLSGGHYVNVHTSENPSGEIRGQILADNFALVTFALNGEQEVPAVSTDAMGSGYALIDMNDYALELQVVTSGVSDATAAHIHTGRIGTNGGVLVGLEQSTDDMNVWKAPANTNLTEAVFNTLIDGGHYVNVHTPANAGGEIRGQILTDHFNLLTFPISGSQEVPAVTTDAMGSGYALVYLLTNELELKAVTSGVSDATAAHIHAGILGVNGDVVVALEQDSSDTNIWMTPDNTMLEQSVLDTFLDAGHYINIHTPANPSGQIRGQIVF
ncbi:CHRD domain-containing protein [Catenovulum adriaticum]|uniref:CHRD domain-containing protein n=1 Tax=Catenovulum adriaticum TaxID=2984846 RepID=A0ABY7AV77_9ALTE|nr:CHRD domain-containing protein [Catenovulum sp. TS8]WAJ72415.1 CHRD domain-containing protein [Catenovulum sp. TS8]